jgi:hypothetical protein
MMAIGSQTWTWFVERSARRRLARSARFTEESALSERTGLLIERPPEPLR